MWSKPLERFIPAALVLGLWGQAVFLGCFMGACAGGADSSGYLNTARLLARGETSTAIRTITASPTVETAQLGEDVYTPLGFRPILGGGKISSIYPIGLPLFLSGAAKVTSWRWGPSLVVGVHAILGVLLVYALGRATGLSPGWSALGSVILGASPLYTFLSLQVFSDVPALVWTTLCVLAAARSRDRSGWALLAGVAFGIAVLIRPTNLLAVLPSAILLGRDARRLLLFVIGGLPAAAVFCAYNQYAYGAAFSLGYFNPPDSFALHRVDSTFLKYAWWLPVLLTPLVMAVALLPWARNLSKQWRVVLGLWIVAFLGFYSTYLFTHMAWWFLRFLLPAFPALIVASLHVLRSFSARKPGPITPAVAWVVVSIMVLLHGALWTRALHARYVGAQERRYETTALWLRAHLPANAIVCAMQDSGALFYYTNFAVVRWDCLEPKQFPELVRLANRSGRPLYAALQEFEQIDGHAFTQHIPGEWEPVEHVEQTMVWRFVLPQTH